jgi:outer membrane protein OmpA-like peptidoglycan-associated protein
MKNANLIGTFLLGMSLAAGVTGCKHKPMLTPIPNNGGPPEATPGANTGSTGNNNLSPGNTAPPPTQPLVTGEPIPQNANGAYAGVFLTGDQNRDKFKADTVYFDFDSSAIKPGEQAKLQEVAAYFKDNQKMEALIIEGNCDERGTEKYNLSLGERRALAAREFIANLGVDPARIKTVTYGASHAVDPGHNESAWKQNRRDEFILVTPK